MSTKTTFSAIPVPAAIQADMPRVMPAVFALLFGAFIVLGVGFAQSATIHDAAHDGRHALAFPCH